MKNKQQPADQNKTTQQAIQQQAQSKQGQHRNYQDQVPDPRLLVKVDKEEYYENDQIQGTVCLKLEKDIKDFIIRISLIYQENYVIFNEQGDQALQSKDFKKKLVKEDIQCKDPYLPGEHTFQFGIQIPNEIKAGTFYHGTKELSARIAYKVQAKVIEKQTEEENQRQKKPKSYKGYMSVKINNHFKYVTIQKVLFDETTVSKFMCFGGGTVNVEVEYMRDTFCVNPTKFQQPESQNSSQQQNSLYNNSEDINENSENIIKANYQIENTKNKMKVDEVLIQLLQIVAICDDKEPGADGKKIVKHVKEVLFEKKQEGVYPRDETQHPRSINISLSRLYKKVLKNQSEEGIYGDLSATEIKYSQGLQQTSTGTYIENFYLLRIKALVNQDVNNSPYVDNQIYFCYHDVPVLDLNESQLEKMEEMQERFFKDREAEGNENSVQIRTHSIAVHHHSDDIVHHFHHFHINQHNERNSQQANSNDNQV